ncbi:MAG: DUF6249 domain-containing protein [Woeseiaceae bacterium]
MIEELIPIVMFLGLTIVFCVLFWLRYRARREMQETFRIALDKGHELTPEIIDRLGHPKASKDKDLRLGVIWMAIAVGLALIAIAVPDPSGHAMRGILAGAAFPFSIGVAYMVLYRFTERGQ